STSLSACGDPAGFDDPGVSGPEGSEAAGPQFAQLDEALSYNSVPGFEFDDSAAPLHVAMSLCAGPDAAHAHDLICPVHPDYALVGGGAYASGAAALVARSEPLDDYFWRASSEDPNDGL